MSIIAWDGKLVASDSMSVAGNLKLRAPKVAKLTDGRLVAFAGNLATGLLMTRWIEKGEYLEDFPKAQYGEDFANTMVICPDGTAYEYEKASVKIPISPPYAIGSGRDMAIGAMAAGANAARAAAICCQWCDGCGFDVMVFEPGGKP